MGTLALLSTDGKTYYFAAASTAGEAKVAEQGNIAAIANPGSPTNNYAKTREICNFGIVASTAAQTIGGGAANDTHLYGVSLSTALTGAVTLSGFGSATGSTAISWTIPAGTAKGFIPYQWAPNVAGALTVTLASSVDVGNVGIHWRPA